MITKILSVILLTSTFLMLFVSCGNPNRKKSENTGSDELLASARADINQYIGEDLRTIYPIKVISYDAEGKPVIEIFDKAPLRAITTNLSSIETMLELGLEDHIIGKTKPDNEIVGKWKDAIDRYEIIGDKMTISKEIIVSKSPDIIIGAARGLTDQYMGAITSYNNMGIKVFTQSSSITQNNPRLTSIIDDVRMIGLIFDVNERARKYADELEEKYNSVIARVSRKKNNELLSLFPMVAFDPEKRTYSSFTVSNGLQLDILNALSLKSAVQGATVSNNYENLISINPDIILYIKAERHESTDNVAVNFIKKDPLLKNISAIRENRIYTTTYDNFMDYGPRNFDTLIQLYEEIYGNK